MCVLRLSLCSGRKFLITALALVQNLAGPKSGGETPHSVTEFISKDIDELLREAEEEEFGSCRQEIMTVLVCRQIHYMIHY